MGFNNPESTTATIKKAAIPGRDSGLNLETYLEPHPSAGIVRIRF